MTKQEFKKHFKNIFKEVFLSEKEYTKMLDPKEQKAKEQQKQLSEYISEKDETVDDVTKGGTSNSFEVRANKKHRVENNKKYKKLKQKFKNLFVDVLNEIF